MTMSADTASVLLIDAFSDEAQMYAEYLGACGFTTRMCSDPEHAIDEATRETPDAVVTRLRQAGPLTGIDIARRLRGDDATRDVAIVMITTSMSEADRESAFHAGCDAYLVLPTLPDVLLAEIRRVLALRRVGRPRPAPAASRLPDKRSGTA